MQTTAQRHSLVKRRIARLYFISGWHAEFMTVWPHLKGRVGGITAHDVDMVITGPNVNNHFDDAKRSNMIDALSHYTDTARAPRHVMRAASASDSAEEGEESDSASSRSPSPPPPRHRHHHHYNPASPRYSPDDAPAARRAIREARAGRIVAAVEPVVRQLRWTDTPAARALPLIPPPAPARAPPRALLDQAPQADSDSDVELLATPMRSAARRPTDDEDDPDLAMAIRLSLMDTGAAAAAIVPDTDKKHEGWESCVICLDDYPPEFMINVSFCCEHRFCKTCIIGMFKAACASQVKCPECKKHPEDNKMSAIVPNNRTVAPWLVDPHFVSGLDPAVDKLLSNGNQLVEFRGTEVEKRASCAACSGLCMVIEGSWKMRCTRSECGKVGCRRCGLVLRPHEHNGIHICPTSDACTEILLANTTTKCPLCGLVVAHSRDHGCHHMTCARCNAGFCFICRKMVIKDAMNREERDIQTCRCPVFCSSLCGCVPCEDCKPGKPCSACEGCAVCKQQ